MSFVGLDVLCFYALKKKKKKEEKRKKNLQKSSALQDFNVLMFSQFHFLVSPIAQSNNKIARTKLVSFSLLPF